MTVYAGQFGPDAFQDKRGNRVPDAEVTIYELGTTTLATLYVDRDRTTTLANPLPTGVASGAPGLDLRANGIFYADPNQYTMVVRHRGVVVGTWPIVIEVDPDEDASQAEVEALAVNRDVMNSINWSRWDVFDRADGTLATRATLPSGHTWIITGAAQGVPLGPELVIVDGTLKYLNRDAPLADPKAYMWTTGSAFSKFSAGFSFDAGAGTPTDNGVIGFIISPLATDHSNGPTGVATNSIHGSFGPNSWSVSILDQGVFHVFASGGLDGNYENPLVAGLPYTVSFERIAYDQMRIHLPTLRVAGQSRWVDINDTLLQSRTGTDYTIDEWWGTTALIEFFQPVATAGTDRHATFHGYAVEGPGEPYATAVEFQPVEATVGALVDLVDLWSGGDRLDDFDRPDGTLATRAALPTTQTWTITGTPAGVPLGPQLVIENGALIYDTVGDVTADPNAYMWTTGSAFSDASVEFSFGAGSTTLGLIALALSPLNTDRANGATGVATNSIFGTFGPNSWSVAIYDAASVYVIASGGLDGNYVAPLTVDQHYTVRLERISATAFRIHLPTTRVAGQDDTVDVTDASILSRTGYSHPDGAIEHWWGTTALMAFFQPVATLATDRHATIYEYATSGLGTPEFVPTADKGIAGGVASLDAAALVPVGQIPDPWRPDEYQIESHPRRGWNQASAVLTSGTLRMELIYLTAGVPVTALDFVASSTPANVPLNQWAGIFDYATRQLLAVSTDRTTEAWAANNAKSFPLTFTPTVTGRYYAGLVVVASTVPTLLGTNSNATLNGKAPIVAGNSTTGRTTPEAVGFTAGAITPSAVTMWVGVKL